ncbi:MAG: DUF4956 domain-containing protein [Pseudomonadota bacterium]
MRKSGGILIPLTIILIYYAAIVASVLILVRYFPFLDPYLPVGGVDDLAASNTDSFEPIYTSVERTLLAPTGPIRLAVSCLGSVLLVIPVSWVYFMTSRERRIDQSFLQTIMILPIVVTGISMIVLNSLALAFSLAGVVAAVRFRFSLNQPSDAMYIFVAIAIGLGSGIGAVGVALVISLAFVLATMFIWRLEYGKTLSGPFLTMITRRDAGEDEY